MSVFMGYVYLKHIIKWIKQQHWHYNWSVKCRIKHDCFCKNAFDMNLSVWFIITNNIFSTWLHVHIKQVGWCFSASLSHWQLSYYELEILKGPKHIKLKCNEMWQKQNTRENIYFIECCSWKKFILQWNC